MRADLVRDSREIVGPRSAVFCFSTSNHLQLNSCLQDLQQLAENTAQQRAGRLQEVSRQ